MKPMPAKIANTSACALLKPMAGVCAYDVWTGATDADWKEDQHKRADNGQFGSGASRAAATKHAVGSEAHGHHIAAAEHHEAAEKATDPTAKAEHLEFAKQRTGQAEAAAGEKKDISHGELKKKLEGMPHEKLTASLKNEAVDPKIKKLIEAELDSRANRGTMKGHGESDAVVKPMPAKIQGNPAQPGTMRHVMESTGVKPMSAKAAGPAYNATAVGKVIKASKPKIGGKEASSIHRLLKGRH